MWRTPWHSGVRWNQQKRGRCYHPETCFAGPDVEGKRGSDRPRAERRPGVYYNLACEHQMVALTRANELRPGPRSSACCANNLQVCLPCCSITERHARVLSIVSLRSSPTLGQGETKKVRSRRAYRPHFIGLLDNLSNTHMSLVSNPNSNWH